MKIIIKKTNMQHKTLRIDLGVCTFFTDLQVYDFTLYLKESHVTETQALYYTLTKIGHLLGGICKISRMVMGSTYVFISCVCSHMILFALNATCLLVSVSYLISALPHLRGR